MKNFIMKNKGKILFALAIAIVIALVSVYIVVNLPKEIAIEKKEENYPKAITEQLQETENYIWTQDKTNVTNGKITLEVGSKITGYEANGVSDKVLETVDEKIKIPMAGKTESLNASVATAIVLYEAVRQKMTK